MEIANEMMTVGVTVGLAGAGMIAGVLKWSIGRNIASMDAKITEMNEKLDELSRNHRELKDAAVTTPECSCIRRECSDRHATMNRDIIEWMRRGDDKFDRLLMMIANLNNGQGGVK